jgi:hypothetical protein
MSELKDIRQQDQFDTNSNIGKVAESFPAIWIALEQLTSPNPTIREAGLDLLIDMKAHQVSPLVNYTLASLLEDPNIQIRFKVVQILGELMEKKFKTGSLNFRVRQGLTPYLSKMRQRNVFALLQVADYHRSAESGVAALLKGCSHAGRTLSDIFLDRKIPINIRRQAIIFSGIVGFLETVPALEKLATRLEARMNGQRLMSFAPPTDDLEKSLIPTIQTALALLNFQ